MLPAGHVNRPFISGSRHALSSSIRRCELSGTNGIASFSARHALPMAIADDFQDRLCGLLRDAKRVERGSEGYTHLMASSWGSPSFAPIANHRDAFWKLISETTAALTKAIAARQGQPAD